MALLFSCIFKKLDEDEDEKKAGSPLIEEEKHEGKLILSSK